MLPAILGVFYFLGNTLEEMGKTTEGKNYTEVFKESILEAYKNAFLPYDQAWKNIANIFVPIHVPAAQFLESVSESVDIFFNGVYSDKINWDDVLSDVRDLEEYKNITDEEWNKIGDFLKNSGRDMQDLINLDMNQVNEDLKTVDKITTDDTATWEPGFMAWSRLHFLTDAVFNTDTGMGKAKNPVDGTFKSFEIQPENKTFRERENN
jgi:hypothetical protein